MLFGKGGRTHGCIQGGENAELYRHVKPSSAGQVAVAEGEGVAVPDAVAARGLGLYHERIGLHLQGRCGQHLRHGAGAGGRWVHCAGAGTPRGRYAGRHRIYHSGAAQRAGST